MRRLTFKAVTITAMNFIAYVCMLGSNLLGFGRLGVPHETDRLFWQS